MRDGLPVIALATAIVALIVAIAGLAYRGSDKPEEAPEELLQNAMNRLSAIEAERKSMRVELDKLQKDVTRALEAIGGRLSGPSQAELERLAQQAVDTALRKRLEEEAAKAGVSMVAPQRPSAQQQFESMFDALAGAVKPEPSKLQGIKGMLSGLRTELNTIYRSELPEAERNKRAASARARTEEALKKLLSAEEFARYEAWKKSSTDEYVQRFFGLGGN